MDLYVEFAARGALPPSGDADVAGEQLQHGATVASLIVEKLAASWFSGCGFAANRWSEGAQRLKEGRRTPWA